MPTTFLIEDDPAASRLIREMLKNAPDGITCIGYADRLGLALPEIEAKKPDVVLLDLGLPDSQGLETLSAVHRRFPEMPLVVLTGLNDQAFAADAVRAGAQDYLIKGGFTVNLLTRAVTYAIEREQGKGKIRRLNAELERRVQERTAGLERANATLATKEEEIRSIVDNLLSCVIGINDEGIIHSANAATKELFGYSVEEVIGRNVSMLMPEPDHVAQDGYIQRHLLTGEAPIMGTGRDVEGLHKDGTRIPLHLSINEYFIGGERHFTGILSDNREHIRIQNELAQARDQAEHASRAKSEFLAAMSHEIRTPMNGIIGTLDVLQQSSLMGAQMEMVTLIRESADALLTIINDILDFSKIEAGRLEIECLPMSVAEVIEKTCELLNRVAERSGVFLTVFADPGIPATLLGDAARVRQILFNLIGNAIKFSSGQSHPGRISARATITERGPDRVVVELRITDNGIGMDDATVGRLFTSFTQADASTTRRYGGTGLGLAICKQLATLMGGDIAVETQLDKGSTFTVHVPFGLGPALADAAPAASVIEGLTCLVIGGEAGLAGDLATYLEADAASVARVQDLAAARDWNRTHAPGLAVWVVDAAHELPTTDELQSAIRARTDLDLRVVLVTIGRGRRRKPRAQADGVIMIDGNALNRHTLANAVAIAAGRASLEAELFSDDQPVTKSLPPSREEAIRQHKLILVAEDNDINQKVIRHQLNLLGYAADVAASGREALKRWRTGDYALLLTDLHMPEMNGYDLALEIRVGERGGTRLPIIALTANALRGESERCLAAGMDDYLSKPAPLSALAAVLEKWLPSATAATKEIVDSRAASVEVSALEALVGPDPEIIREFLQDFSVSAARIAAELVAASRTGHPKRAAAAAHKLKSSARSVGAWKLGDVCTAIEVAGNAGEIGALAALVAGLENEMLIVDEYLRSFLGREKPPRTGTGSKQ